MPTAKQLKRSMGNIQTDAIEFFNSGQCDDLPGNGLPFARNRTNTGYFSIMSNGEIRYVDDFSGPQNGEPPEDFVKRQGVTHLVPAAEAVAWYLQLPENRRGGYVKTLRRRFGSYSLNNKSMSVVPNMKRYKNLQV